MNETLYREHILDHYAHPRNKGELANPTCYACELNPLCGDTLCLSLDVQNGMVQDVKFSGHGCAISQAAASVLTEHVKGKPVAELAQLTKEDVLALLGIEVTPARLKCALLILEVLRQSLRSSDVGLPEASLSSH